MSGDRRTGAEAGLLAEITLPRLRHHFQEKYLLNESQVELMVFSSAQSVREGLGRLAALGEGTGRQEQIGAYHGLKGLFLNMGEERWAEFARGIECRLKAGEWIDHREISRMLCRGAGELLGYGEGESRSIHGQEEEDGDGD